MNINEAFFMSLLSAAINDHPVEAIPDGIDLGEVFHYAVQNSVMTLIYPVINSLKQDNELLNHWKMNAITVSVSLTELIEGFRPVLEALYSQKLRVVFYKGIIIRELYKYPELRTMCDIDILVEPQDSKTVDTILRRFGYIEVARDHRVVTYSHPQLITLELHQSIAESNSDDDYEIIDREAWNNCVPGSCLGLDVCTLSVSFHLCFLIIHMHKHFVYNGVGVRQLCDIALYLKRYQSEVDWDYFWDFINKNDTVLPFAVYVFLVCEEYFDIRIPILEMSKEIKEIQTNIEIFVMQLIRNGTFGSEDSGTSLENSLVKKMRKVSFLSIFAGYITDYLFPGPDRIGQRYSYIKKYPFLLPVAWIHRMAYTLFHKRDLAYQHSTSMFNLAFSRKHQDFLKSIGTIRKT